MGYGNRASSKTPAISGALLFLFLFLKFETLGFIVAALKIL